jgi:transcriptional regulator with XRE-family HTH domain
MTVQPSAHSVHHTCFLDAPDVPAVLRMARAAMGWSQADFAVVAGLSLRTVKAIELNETDPKMSTLKRLSAVLHHHGIRLWRDGSGAVGITCCEKERKIVQLRKGAAS